ncbi:MAG: hypothetical protein VW456_02790 [Alphaproteobacteria bacterium]
MHPALIFHKISKFITRMTCRVTCLVVMVMICLTATPPAIAKMANRCDEPVFGAASIAIDKMAATAAEAQQTGVDAAAQTAFQQVLNRVLLSNEDQAKFAAAHSYDAFTDFVHIIEEKNLEKRYIARLDFCFDAERMRTAIQQAGLQWAELQSPPILLLPVWKDPDGTSAWLKNNSWIVGWNDAVDKYDGLVSLRRLPHSLTHERRFRGADLLAGDPIKLAAAARIAEAEQVLVVAATLDYEGSKRVVDVEARLFDKTGRPITTISSLSDIKLGKSDNAQLDATRQSILDRIEGSWRNANLIDSNATGYLLVDVPVTSVKQWSDRLAALQQVAVIKNVTIRTLGSDGGSVSLALVGSREALKNALASHDLALVDKGDVISIIAKSDGQ